MMIEKRYEGRLIGSPTLQAIRAVVPDYEVMLVAVLDAMLERYERGAGYHFIDTKLSLLSGQDFPTPADDAADFRGRTAVYGWIQGRGLESLVGHIRWLGECTVLEEAQKADRRRRLTRMVREVFEQMERIRAANGGRVWFVTDPDGRAFDMDEAGRRRYFDLGDQATTNADRFYAKGMLAAATLLERPDKVAEAGEYLRRVLADVEAGRAGRDRFSFDPKNKVEAVAGQYGHGARMISLGTLAMAMQQLPGPEWIDTAQRFIRYVLDRHVNRGQAGELEPYDFFEYTDQAGRPWRDAEGRILCDPGHSLELVGLVAKVLLLMREGPLSPGQRKALEEAGLLLPGVLLKNFANGWNRRVGGICKLVDLRARRPVNSDMPWWPLPETMRAAAELLLLAPQDPRRQAILQVIADCSNAFVKNFVNRKAHLMAYQTLDEAGRPVDVIPATPDADPGYHTGLSIIDFIRCMRQV